MLAGGQGRRIGGNKHLVVFQGKSLLERALETLGAVAEPPLRVIGLDVPDRLPGCGPLGGLLTGLELAEQDWSYVLAVDYPELSPSTLRALVPKRAEARVVHALDHPLVGLYHRELAAGLERYLLSGERRVMGWLRTLGEQVETVPDLPGLLNLNSI